MDLARSARYKKDENSYVISLFISRLNFLSSSTISVDW